MMSNNGVLPASRELLQIILEDKSIVKTTNMQPIGNKIGYISPKAICNIGTNSKRDLVFLRRMSTQTNARPIIKAKANGIVSKAKYLPNNGV